MPHFSLAKFYDRLYTATIHDGKDMELQNLKYIKVSLFRFDPPSCPVTQSQVASLSCVMMSLSRLRVVFMLFVMAFINLVNGDSL